MIENLDIRPYVPSSWFSGPTDNWVLFRAFRVFKVASTEEPASFKLFEFADIMVVLFSGGVLKYADPNSIRIIQTPSGDPCIDQSSFNEKYTEKGTYLLLITPYKNNGKNIDETLIKDQLRNLECLIAIFSGRNLVFEKVFDNLIRCDERQISVESAPFESPSFYPQPDISTEALKTIDGFYRAIIDIEKERKYVVEQCLKWFHRGISSMGIDQFINYWIALETIGMSDANVAPVVDKLAKINGVDAQLVRDRLHIGRIQVYRSKIMHDGHMPPIRSEIVTLLFDIIVDLLADYMKISINNRTKKYIDADHEILKWIEM